MEVLVTGGTGYIGSHTVVELLQAGCRVVIADNLSRSGRGALDGIRAITGQEPAFHKVDCRDRAALGQVFDQHPGIGAVIHFAAFKSVGESCREPLAYYENNIGSLVNLLQVARGRKVRNFVFSSSCTVYGEPETVPVTENTPLRDSSSPYGATKRMCERILFDACRADQSLSVTALRYFNPIGAHESALLGETPDGVPQNLVPYLTETAAGLRDHLSVFGNDYNTPDGTCIRDYIHVSDLARAHTLALRRMAAAEPAWRAYNIGTGRGTSVKELISAFTRATGIDIPVTYAPRRAGDIERVWADPSLAERELGWKSEHTLEDTLLSAWRWQQHITCQGK